MLPLKYADNKEQIIKRITGSPEMKVHLQDLGFVPGSQVKVISSIKGNLIVEIKGVRIALDSSLASRINV